MQSADISQTVSDSEIWHKRVRIGLIIGIALVLLGLVTTAMSKSDAEEHSLFQG